ncbi:MAG TPA: acyltransferase [Candidatus Acidoferrum sp.]|nr:acyltransferase [Candidatus Acidoferrum sp.]
MSIKATRRNEGALTRAGYYPVLDVLRFILAFWVAVGHYGMIPLFGDPTTGAGLWYLFKRGWETVVFGTPAVLVFFVISGFCIHLPFRGSGKIDVARYYLRRYTRILIPVAGALVVYRLLGQHMTFWGEHSILWESPLWSLACEEIYYAMYPLLRWIRNKVGWKILLPASFALSVPIAATHPHAGNWHVFGPFGTAMMLLPVWLLGCLLAEQGESLVELNPRWLIWGWRFLAWLGSWVAEMMHFKMGISYTQTMVWFGVLAYFWLRQEVAHGKNHPPNRYLVAAGAWSYSLYLVHAQGGGLFGWLRLPSMGRVIDWALAMASSLIFAYAFYFLVERPSHRLARKIKVKGARNVVGSGKDTQSLPSEKNPLAKEAVQV